MKHPDRPTRPGIYAARRFHIPLGPTSSGPVHLERLPTAVIAPHSFLPFWRNQQNHQVSHKEYAFLESLGLPPPIPARAQTPSPSSLYLLDPAPRDKHTG